MVIRNALFYIILHGAILLAAYSSSQRHRRLQGVRLSILRTLLLAVLLLVVSALRSLLACQMASAAVSRLVRRSASVMASRPVIILHILRTTNRL